MEGDLLVIGEIINVQGVKGRLKVISFGDSAQDFLFHLSGKKIILRKKNGIFFKYKLNYFQPYKNIFIISLDGLDTRNDAEKLVGCEIYIPRSNLSALPSGEYYWFEIIGLNVFNKQGKSLGKIREILPTGSNDVYISETKGREYLIPATTEVVLEINLNKEIMIIQPPEGLFEDNEI